MAAQDIASISRTSMLYVPAAKLENELLLCQLSPLSIEYSKLSPCALINKLPLSLPQSLGSVATTWVILGSVGATRAATSDTSQLLLCGSLTPTV